jgi:NitT/TauT family transport system permease protein
LGGSGWRIVTKVVLPAAMPTAFAGILLGLIMGIVMLTVAETVGAASGIGYYLMYYKDVAAYDRIVADIFVIAGCVYFWTYFFDKVQDRTLRWQRGSK